MPINRRNSPLVLKTAMSCGKILCQIDQGMLAWRKGWLGIFDEDSFEFSPMVDLRLGWKGAICSASRFLERCLRETPRCAALFDGKAFVTRNGYLLEVDLDSWTVKNSLIFRDGMRSPLSLSVIDGIHGFDDCLAFGDYWGNPNREEVCINVLCKGQKEWCRAVILPAGSACHIHAIVPDKGRDRVLVLTGDADEESAIIEFKSNFNECRILLSGRQQFRSCVAVPWKDGILFATDSPLERNGLYYLADSELQLITSLRGSCIYYDELPDGGMVFSTTVEPDSNLTGWKYIVSRKPGPGITGNQVDLCMVGKQGFNVLESFEKDAWPSLLFQFGAIEPVIGSRHIFLNFTALKNHDRSVMAVDLPGSEIRMHNEGLK